MPEQGLVRRQTRTLVQYRLPSAFWQRTVEQGLAFVADVDSTIVRGNARIRAELAQMSAEMAAMSAEMAEIRARTKAASKLIRELRINAQIMHNFRHRWQTQSGDELAAYDAAE